MFGERLNSHNAKVWLVNTGWSGGPYGIGTRMSLRHTRAMVRAALTGQLDCVTTIPDSVFGLHVPQHVPNVPDDVLNPRATWHDSAEYDRQATKLASMFHRNFAQFVHASDAVRAAGPIRLTGENADSRHTVGVQ
jgi:phosphoenolpyruvate carboxykinase (ATP)